MQLYCTKRDHKQSLQSAHKGNRLEFTNPQRQTIPSNISNSHIQIGQQFVRFHIFTDAIRW